MPERVELPLEYVRQIKQDGFWEKRAQMERCKIDGHTWVADKECPQLEICRWCQRCSVLV